MTIECEVKQSELKTEDQIIVFLSPCGGTAKASNKTLLYTYVDQPISPDSQETLLAASITSHIDHFDTATWGGGAIDTYSSLPDSYETLESHVNTAGHNSNPRVEDQGSGTRHEAANSQSGRPNRSCMHACKPDQPVSWKAAHWSYPRLAACCAVKKFSDVNRVLIHCATIREQHPKSLPLLRSRDVFRAKGGGIRTTHHSGVVVLHSISGPLACSLWITHNLPATPDRNEIRK